MKEKVIVSWFYRAGRCEGGAYAQTRGDSASDMFLDVYRKCLVTFYVSARRANPQAQLVLYVNSALAGDTSTSRVLIEILDRLSVSVVVIGYDWRPPVTWTKAWNNQFFLFDVLSDIQKRWSGEALVTVLDSDVVWNSERTAETMWKKIESAGVLTYEVGYESAKVVNGASMDALRRLADRNSYYVTDCTYSGGEFVGFRNGAFAAVLDACGEFYACMKSEHAKDSSVVCEEAHVLSMAYSHVGIRAGTANEFVKRVWTQPFKYRNTSKEDINLALWHVPAEKKYGLRRMYRRIVAGGIQNEVPNITSLDRVMEEIPASLGIPRNSGGKVLLDLAHAAVTRVHLGVISRK